jgi:hypothetical protein
VELSAGSLEWTDGPQSSTVDGTEAVAQAVSPLRAVDQRFDRYTSAVRYVDTPALFENRPSYRLLDVSWTDDVGTMNFGLSAHFDKLDVSRGHRS